MSNNVYYARGALGAGTVRGQAIVAKDGFSARYDLDRLQGTFSRPSHKLAGQSYVGRVLVLDVAKGGVATAWMLNEMAARCMVPRALVLNVVNPIMVQGAALAGVPLLSDFDVDITTVVPHEANVLIDFTSEKPCLVVEE